MAHSGAGEAVRVVVRLRPEEVDCDSHGANACADGQRLGGSCVLTAEDKKLTIIDPATNRGRDNEKQAHDFAFDRVFGPGASQSEVFEIAKPLVHATVDGKELDTSTSSWTQIGTAACSSAPNRSTRSTTISTSDSKYTSSRTATACRRAT